MEYIYAALLLHNAGKDVTDENVAAVLEAAGVAVEDVRVKALVAALEDVNIEEAISQAAVAPAAALHLRLLLPRRPRPPPLQRRRLRRRRRRRKRKKRAAWPVLEPSSAKYLFLAISPLVFGDIPECVPSPRGLLVLNCSAMGN
jgi:large subunit ribosomal protein L12